MNKQAKANGGRGIEEWRDIPGCRGLYQASSLGRIRSLGRNTTSGKVLAAQVNNSGYLRVSVTLGGVSNYMYVHRLVARAFVGIPADGLDVNHINGDKSDNCSDNLEYVTRTENMEHARMHGLHNNRADGHYNAKLNTELVRYIRFAHNTCGVRGKDLAQSVGVSSRTIDDVLDGKTWRSVNE